MEVTMAHKQTDPVEILATNIVNSMSSIAARRSDTASFDKSFYATILGVNQKFTIDVSSDDQTALIEKFSLPESIEDGENNYYIFKINGAYYCKQQNGDFKLYDKIMVYIPNGDWSRMYIDRESGSTGNSSDEPSTNTSINIISSPTAPGGDDPIVGDIWLRVNDDTTTVFNEISAEAFTDLYAYLEDEETEIKSWVNVRCPIGSAAPSGDSVYYLRTSNGKLSKLYRRANNGGSIITWQEIYPNSETGTEYNLTVSLDKPMSAGDIWVRIDSLETQNIISCSIYEFDEDNKKYSWKLLYNSTGGGSKIHVSVDEPKPLAEGDFLVMMPDTSTVSALYRYVSGQWSTVNFLYGTNPPAPIADTYYCIVAAGALRYILDGNNSWATVAPTPNAMYINAAAIISPNDYWIKITDETNRIATTCYQYLNDEWVEQYKFGATLGNGLEYDANGNIQAKLGEGLTFDSNGAIKMAYNPVINISHALVYKKASQE